MLWFILFVFLPSTHAESIHMREVHVIGSRRSSLVENAHGSSRLEARELVRRSESTLGETLKAEAGVNSSSFGPGASRPVIRGFDGDRVRVLQNGLGNLDASSQSVDHAVPVDPLNVEAVEILRGPPALMYGASAVGGVVNLTNPRIHDHFEAGHLAQVETRAESAFGGMGHAVRLDHGSDGWMFHLDGSFRDFGDQRIPGKARSARLRRENPVASADEVSKRLPNSQELQRAGALGVTRVFDRGHLGLSFGHYSSDYGSVAEPTVEILMRQNRWELGSEYRPRGGWADKLRLRSAQSRYRHDEVESGSVGTVFKNSGNETRLEAERTRGAHSSVWGIQGQFSEFSAQGEEAYLPTANNGALALFTLQRYRRGAGEWSFSARGEESRTRKEGSADFGEGTTRGFTGLNAALGWASTSSTGWEGGVDLSYTERAPNFQELFANGAHVATGTYEVGEQALGKEKASGLQGRLGYSDRRYRGQVSAFVQDFDGYVALSPDGGTDTDSDFPIFRYEAVGARLHGAETEHRWQASPDWKLVAKGDWVRGVNTDDGKNLPRLSPARASVGAEWAHGRWDADIELQHVFMQTKTAPRENATDGYEMLNLGVGHEWAGEETRLHLFARVKNLLDQEARAHTSTVKEIAPLPGRNVVLGARAVF